MRRWTINIILLILLCAARGTYNEIVWQSATKLDWNDFGQKPKGSNYAALTASGISYSYTKKQDSYDIEIYAVFDKDESWVNEALASSNLLTHEQLHFDITELWTRKLRKAILESPYIDDITLAQLYDKHLKGLVRMQEYYDEQSHHSLNKGSQQEWEIGVKDELEKLSTYMEPRLLISRESLALN